MKPLVLPIVLVIWLAAACGGLCAIARYDHRAGLRAPAPHVWPSDSALTFDPGVLNFVLSLHPQCSCSNATLSELETILAQSGDRLNVHAIVVLPENAPESWRQGDLVARLNTLPHVHVTFDSNGVESQRFGALTSGDAMLFSSGRELLFRGGITESRGHIGENAGRQTILAVVQGKPVQCGDAPVFGCSLRNHAETQP